MLLLSLPSLSPSFSLTASFVCWFFFSISLLMRFSMCVVCELVMWVQKRTYVYFGCCVCFFSLLVQTIIFGTQFIICTSSVDMLCLRLYVSINCERRKKNRWNQHQWQPLSFGSCRDRLPSNARLQKSKLTIILISNDMPIFRECVKYLLLK